MNKAFKDLETADELKNYLDSSFRYVRKSVFHYTSCESLLSIFKDCRFKFSSFSNTNDVLEEKYVKDELKQKHYLCFMRTMIENFGMWAMYGGLTENPTDNKKTYVKIEIPVTELKKFIAEKNLKANLVAYTNLFKSESNGICTCGALKNSKKIKLDPKILSGYVKDNAWGYEQEIRIWSDNEYENLSDDFLKSWKIIPSPMITVEKLKGILESDCRYESVKELMNIVENQYAGTYRAKACFNN